MKKIQHIEDLGPIQLWRLRQDIILNSLYLNDYENRYDIDLREVNTFFDSYLNYLEDLMEEEIVGFKDEQFFDYLGQYDNRKNLIDWHNIWCC